jgi:hypothetical protein
MSRKSARILEGVPRTISSIPALVSGFGDSPGFGVGSLSLLTKSQPDVPEGDAATSFELFPQPANNNRIESANPARLALTALPVAWSHP